MSASGPAVVPRLSLMMFLQYAVWGAWLPVAARYMSAGTDVGGLGFAPTEIGKILGLAGSIGALAAPFLAGQVADRYFRTERFLAFLLIVGGAVKWITASQTSYDAWLWLSIAYSVVYMPTLALSNSMAFTHLEDEERQFPLVRVWGTLGWIAASWIFPMVWLQSDLSFQLLPPFLVGTEVADSTARLADSLRFSALISFGYALFCLALPATPPKRGAAEPLAFRAAFGLLRRPSFAVLVLASLAVSVIHQIYFLQTPIFFSHLGLADSQIGPVMTLGQVSEILVMAGLGWMLKRLGFRVVIFLGALAYFARYAIWGFTDWPVSMLVGSQILHGVCYGCFFAGAFIYVDKLASADIRHSAQTVFGILILGGGPVLGGYLYGWLGERYTPSGSATPDFATFWWILSAIGLVTALFFLSSFRDETRSRETA